jgi:hypothetical protein
VLHAPPILLDLNTNNVSWAVSLQTMKLLFM